MKNESINPDYVISLDYSMNGGRFFDSNLYAIVFKDKSIKEFIYMPKDYRLTEFIDVILNKYNRLNYKFIFDNCGAGMGIMDYLKSKDITNYFNINNKKGELALYYNKAMEEILNFAINSEFDYIKELEFKKLIKEMNNLEVGIRGNRVFFEFKNISNKNRSRAFCYLQYMAYLYCLAK